MKLAIINQTASTGGWRYLYMLVSNILKLRPDYEITILISNTNGIEEVEKLKQLGVLMKNINKFIEFKSFRLKNKFKIHIFNSIYNKIRYKKWEFKTKKLFDLNEFDAVFYSWPYDIEPINTNKKLFFIPHDFIFTHFFGFHSGHIYTREWWWKQYLQLKKFVDMGGRPIVSSQYIAEEYNRVYPESKNKPQVVYLSAFNEYKILEKDQIQAVLDKYSITGDYILYANNWALHKNMQGVVGAFYYVKQKYPNIKLIITGYGTDNIICRSNCPYYWDHVRGDEEYDIKTLGLLNENDFSAILQGSKLCINSSLCEAGSGNSLDAWNVKIPVAMSNIPAFKQQLEFLGTKAEIFDPRNSHDIANAILKNLDNPELSKKNAEASKKAMEKYNWKDVAQQYINIFEER